MPIQFGTRLGLYEIASLIGAGGMGEVYRARDTKLGRDVAVKVLPEAFSHNPERLARFRREAKILAALNHPNIAAIYGLEESDGLHFLVLELVEGKTLAERIAAGPVPVAETLKICEQVVQALEHAHKKGITHRDIKPANVKVTPEGRVKVLDFGLARLWLAGDAESDDDPNNARTLSTLPTIPGVILGTTSYMSPEQARGGKVDQRADIWAFGCVLYELLTGHRAFPGTTFSDAIAAVLEREPDWNALPPSTPAQVRDLLEHCLQKDANQRPAEIGEAGSRIEGALVAPRRKPLTRGRAVAMAGAALVALLAIPLGLNLGGVRDRLRWTGLPAPIRSLAVLPLENLSGDPAQEYLSSGIHEALITDLAKLGGFRRVIARSSVMRFEKTAMTPQEIARELGVDALLAGTVVRSGNRVQMTAHLISASGNRVWSERYTREFRDVLSVESEIVSAVVREVQLQTTPQEQARLTSPRQVNTEAFEAYLQGRFNQHKQTREGLDLAESYFEFALEKDPNYALAYSGLGGVWLMRGDAGWLPPSESFPKGAAFLARAVELDDSSAEVHVWLANHKNAVDWDWAGAEREFQRALELNPNLADAHFFYADMLVVTKRNDEWAREIQRARELDPLNDFNKSFYGWHLNYLRRYDEAIPVFRGLLPTGPNKASNYLGLWGAYYKKRMYDEALSAARGYFESISEHESANGLGPGGGEAAYRLAMRRVGAMMAAESTRRHVPAIRIARMFAHAGDKDAAMEWLEKAYQARESPLIRMAVFWDWDELRSDPRFRDLLRRMDLPQ